MFQKHGFLAYFWPKNRFFAILPGETQSQSYHFKTTFNRFYGQKYVLKDVSGVPSVSSRKFPKELLLRESNEMSVCSDE